jgi:FAD/FMN-containing dehydrogenase
MAKALSFTDKPSLKTIIKKHTQVIAFGNGRSYGDSALNTHVIKAREHHYFLDFNDETGVLHVESGVLLSEILDAFIARGWFLKITPGTKLITIGGAIASDVHGKNHHIEGCFSESIIEFNLMLADGSVKLCRKDKNPELFHASCGGMGLTGIILDAKFSLKKINSQSILQTTIKTKNLKQTFDAFERHQKQTYSVAWIDYLAKRSHLGRSLLMVGDFADDGDLQYKTRKKLNIPFNFPLFALNKFSVKIFNFLYYGKVRQAKSQQKVGIDAFFIL